MRDLRLVGLSEDGSRLLMRAPGGEDFGLVVDDRLQAALRGDRNRLGQLEIEMESRLRPREIQALIRSGRSPEEVADEAGISVDRVLRYAGPILHEREHIAQQAAAVGVRRDDHGAVQLLGELVGERLEQRGVPRELLSWDAWRLEDGRWEVRLDYLAADAPRSAQWVYDPARRTVTADDDEARWLLAEEPSATVTTLRRVEPPTVTRSDIPDDVAEVIGLIEPELMPAGDVAEATAAEGSGEPPASAAPRREPPQQVAQRGGAGQRASSRSKRASVPSWDEILFGSKKPE
jgi:DNA-binding CsgD family transcriptional regulator